MPYPFTLLLHVAFVPTCLGEPYDCSLLVACLYDSMFPSGQWLVVLSMYTYDDIGAGVSTKLRSFHLKLATAAILTCIPDRLSIPWAYGTDVR